MSAVFGHGRLRLYLLKLLDESPRHGYDVIRELEDRFMGLYSPSAGTVYPRLARLEAEGLVTHSEEDGRKVYRITDAGREELAARHDELADIEVEIDGSVRNLAQEIRSDVRGSAADLRAELKSAAREMRRETRHRARTESRPSQQGGAQADLDRLVDWFRTEVRDVARRGSPTPEELATLRGLLDDALDDVRRVLRGWGRPG